MQSIHTETLGPPASGTYKGEVREGAELLGLYRIWFPLQGGGGTVVAVPVTQAVAPLPDAQAAAAAPVALRLATLHQRAAQEAVGT